MSPKINFGSAIGSCFWKYALLSGRARRSEYWFWILFCTLITTAISWDSNNIGMDALLPLILPTWAVMVRRLHDTGHSGWLLLAPAGMIVLCNAWTAFFGILDYQDLQTAIGYGFLFVGGLVPFYIAAIALSVWIFILMFQDGNKESNKYGESPKYIAENELPEEV